MTPNEFGEKEKSGKRKTWKPAHDVVDVNSPMLNSRADRLSKDITYHPTHSLVPSQRDDNLVTQKVKDLKRALKRRPKSVPAIVLEHGTNRVIEGHHRLFAAKALGMTHVPTKTYRLE